MDAFFRLKLILVIIIAGSIILDILVAAWFGACVAKIIKKIARFIFK